MLKRSLAVSMALFFLVACSGPKQPPVDFQGAPERGPDLDQILPSYGPNDPVPEGAFNLDESSTQ